LSPVQVKLLPITDRNVSYAEGIIEQLKKENIRAELDDRSETLSAKIRDAQNEKVPYMIVVGDKEEEAETISVRNRAGKNLNSQKLDEFITSLQTEITSKALT
jgi:threonyl-tRNA synthetase